MFTKIILNSKKIISQRILRVGVLKDQSGKIFYWLVYQHTAPRKSLKIILGNFALIPLYNFFFQFLFQKSSNSHKNHFPIKTDFFFHLTFKHLTAAVQ